MDSSTNTNLCWRWLTIQKFFKHQITLWQVELCIVYEFINNPQTSSANKIYRWLIVQKFFQHWIMLQQMELLCNVCDLHCIHFLVTFSVSLCIAWSRCQVQSLYIQPSARPSSVKTLLPYVCWIVAKVYLV